MSTGVSAAFAQRVEHERLRLGWTKSELAARAKLSRATIDRLATQKSLPLPKTVLTLAALFGIDKDEALRLAGFGIDPVPGRDQVAADGMLAWLRATVEGDKAAAEEIRATWATTSWVAERPDGGGDECLALIDEGTRRKLVVVLWGSDRASEDELEHMGIHDPEDTIARCEAELAEMARHMVNFAGDCDLCDEVSPCESLRLKSFGYRHRPGWKEGWTP